MSKNLENIPTEELFKEIERRGEAKKDSTHFVCIGIIDSEGVESLVKCEDRKVFSERLSAMSLRVRFNGHRGAKVYSVYIPQRLYEEYDKQLKNGNFAKVEESLKLNPNFKYLC